jgi:isopenicillin N synthase-like dioxygenase
MSSIELPMIDSLEMVSMEQLNLFKKSGFCFVKINENIMPLLDDLVQAGIKYFAQSEEEKQQAAFNQKFEGYLNHKIKGDLDIERYAYRGGELPQFFKVYREKIELVKQYFVNQIALVLLQKIFLAEKLQQFYPDVTKDYTSTLTFIHYPYREFEKQNRKLKEHKDFVLLIVLYITKPGLEIYLNGRWINVAPNPGYVVVNVGNSLEIMTGNSFSSILHRACPPLGEDRLTLASFVGTNHELTLCNYKTGEVIYNTFQELLDKQLKIVYPGTFE